MGAVYLAEHTLLGNLAAIKVLLPELSSRQEIVDRFFNEAKASTAIKHPGIVQVFDFGYHTSGRDNSAYLVMEYLEGESLEGRLSRLGRLPVIDAMRIIRHCASALAAAHERGIVHRDLKPDNIFLVPDPQVDGGERAKILDFGIAKLSDDKTGKVKTRTGSVMGTPVYMSPEQCRGAGEVDYRADIYSLGCVFFHLLCGQPPFVREGVGNLIFAHMSEAPPAARAIDPNIPPPVEALVARMLAKDPAHRPATMAALVGELKAMAQGLPAVPPPYRQGPDGQVGTPMVTPAPMGNYSTPAQGSQSGAYAAPMPHGVPGTTPPPGTAPPPGTQPPGARPGTGSYPGMYRPTTLGGAAAESSGVRKRGHRKIAAVVALLAVLAVGGGIVAMILGGEQSSNVVAEEPADNAVAAADTPAAVEPEVAPEPEVEPEAPEAPEPPVVQDIIVQVQSDPPGASVYLADQDEPVGNTPYRYTAPPVSDQITLRISKKGYEDGQVAFQGDQNTTVSVALREKKTKKRKKRRRSSDEDEDDLNYR